VSAKFKQNAPKLGAYWMPFTANRQFKVASHLFGAAKGMQYTTTGSMVPDSGAGLRCANAAARLTTRDTIFTP